MSSFNVGPYGGGNGWQPPSPAKTEGQLAEAELNLRDIFAVLRRNVWLVLGIAVIISAGAGFMVWREVPQYRAIGVIRLANTRGAITGGIEAAAMEQVVGRGSDPLLSQLEVFRGRIVLGEVVDREGLRITPIEVQGSQEFLEGVEVEAPEGVGDTITLSFTDEEVLATAGGLSTRANYGEPVQIADVRFTVVFRPAIDKVTLALQPREEAVDRIAGNLIAIPREQTDAVEIHYTAPDPRFAQRVVNTAIEVFQSTSADAAQQQSRRRRIFLEEQLQSIDSVMAEMQAALIAFRSRNQVYSSRDVFAAQQEGLMGLDVRLEELAADRRMYQSLLDQLQRPDSRRAEVLRTLVSSPGVASNAIVTQLYSQLVRYETSRDSLVTGTLGATAAHPDVQRLNVLTEATEERLIDAVGSHVASIDARIAALQGLRERNAGEIASSPTTEAEEVQLVQQVETTRAMGDQLRSELQRARMAEAVEAGQVELVNPAPLPREPVSGGKPLKLSLGVMLGLMLGGGAAFLREHLNTSIRRREDVEEVLRVPGLAVIPQIALNSGTRRLPIPLRLSGPATQRNGTGHQFGSELVSILDLSSSGAEAFRMLRTNILFSQSVDSIKTLVVTSSTPGEGKTTTAANLSAAFAQQGMRVLLIDCDLRRARLHKLFGIAAKPGLTELLMGQTGPQDAVRPAHVENLSILPAGTLPPNPAELLGGPRMKRVLDLLKEGFDLIVLDTPPLMAAADAAILGAAVDGVLMVVRAGQTERGAAQYAMQQLQGVGARVVGAVLNDPDAQVPLYGGYYHYDYYGAEV